jgi:hypothetical protein
MSDTLRGAKVICPECHRIVPKGKDVMGYHPTCRLFVLGIARGWWRAQIRWREDEAKGSIQ